MINALSEIELEQFEYAYLVTDWYWTESPVPMHIPKLMPLIPRTASNIRPTNSTFNNNIFVNDAACKPQVSSSVTTLNHLMVPKLRNASFSYKADEHGYIQSGNKYMVLIMNKNFRDMFLTDNI